MTAFAAIIGFIVVQRLAELIYAARNTRRLLANGGREAGRGHYPLIVFLHVSWLVAILFTVPADAPVNGPLFFVFAALQAGRLWVLLTLGPFWTTRIITLPNAPLVIAGPYRFVRHPNYLIVAGEIAVVPLMFGEWRVAIVFSLLNAAMLTHRIRVEERALANRRADS